MSLNLEISEFFKEFELDDATKDKLIRLFEYAQYLFDDDENLTKTLNLKKEAKLKLIERLVEMFEEEELSKDTSDQQK